MCCSRIREIERVSGVIDGTILYKTVFHVNVVLYTGKGMFFQFSA
jgi:hypothetical protein